MQYFRDVVLCLRVLLCFTGILTVWSTAIMCVFYDVRNSVIVCVCVYVRGHVIMCVWCM